MKEVKKHPQAHLYPSEVVTLAFLFVLKGKSTRGFYEVLSIVVDRPEGGVHIFG